tara:strand:- start:858 stop:1241 length:384 start_codon:yes stop_codon:yes gene_type:complete
LNYEKNLYRNIVNLLLAAKEKLATTCRSCLAGYNSHWGVGCSNGWGLGVPVPSLDLHGLRHHEVQNEVARFLERHLHAGLFVEIITGNSEIMLEESIKIIQQYGLQYYTGYPNYIGRIVVVTYDDVH